MNDQNSDKFNFKVMDKSSDRDATKINKQNPQYQLRTGERNKTEDGKKEGTKICLNLVTET